MVQHAVKVTKLMVPRPAVKKPASATAVPSAIRIVTTSEIGSRFLRRSNATIETKNSWSVITLMCQPTR